MASIKVILYKSKTYKNGSHPLYLQVIHNRKVKKIALNHSLHDFEWNTESNLPKKGIQNYKHLSIMIRSKLTDAEKLLLKLETEKKDFSIDELCGKIKGAESKISFNNYTKDQIERLMKANKIGNAISYRSALMATNNFTGNKDLSFTDIDYKFLKRFEEFHLSKQGNTINGFNVYLRAIRAIYNKAIKEGLVSYEYYPFKDYRLKQTKTVKRAISKEDMLKIVDLDLPVDSKYWHTRNYFLFSFFTIGMSWVDMALLKTSNIQGDRIIYKRSKTGKDYTIKVNNKITDILDYYSSGKSRNDYIFPIISRTESEVLKRNDVKNKLKLYNKQLKEIGGMINCSVSLTSYVARHSWASIANFSGVHIGVIAQGLGHDDIKTTQTYLAEFDHSEIDTANENIL
jgi:integrase/recombinase XerD